MHRIFNRKYQKDFRKELRDSLTPAEASLWKCLQKRQLSGRKFRRQHGIGKYVVDFYCSSEKLVIELDGAGHFKIVMDEYDQERDNYIRSLGITILRFENCEVWDDLEGVLNRIRKCFMG